MSSTPLSTGLRFADRYILKRRLGLGRLGEVWLADDTRLEMEVAIKFFDALEDHSILESVARRCMKITHPHIVRVYDFVEEAGRCALVMEYLEGSSVARRLKEQEGGCFEPTEIQEWVKQLWSALAELHEQKIIHGNLNLANLGIAGTGELKVMEAGFFEVRTAALNPDQTFSFLPCLTPQILAGKQPGPMDDSYAAGACVYEMLTGRPVFFGANLPQQIQEREITPVAVRRAELGVGAHPVPQDWEEWISSSLSKSAYDRPLSAEIYQTLRSAPPVSTVTAEEAAATAKQAASPAARLVDAREKLRRVPSQAWWGLGAAAALAVFYLVSWQPAQKALAEMESAFDSLKRKTLTEAEPPTVLVKAWQDFQDQFDSPIPYTDEDSDMLDDAADFQIVQKKAADEAERARKAEEERLIREREDKLQKLAKTLEGRVESTRAAFMNKEVPAGDNLDGWQKMLVEFDARLSEHKDVGDMPASLKLARKEIEEKISFWSEEEQTQSLSYAGYLQGLSTKLDEAARIVATPEKGASPKVTELENLMKSLPVTPITTRTTHQDLLAKLTALKTEWTEKAMNEAPKEPLDLKTLFAGTAYKELGDDQLKVLLGKLYAGYGLDPKTDPERKLLHEKIIADQRSRQIIPTGQLGLAELTKAQIPEQMSEDEIKGLTASVSKAVATTTKRYSSAKKKVEEEKPGFWSGVGSKFSTAGKKVGGLFTGKEEEKPSAKSKGKK